MKKKLKNKNTQKHRYSLHLQHKIRALLFCVEKNHQFVTNRIQSKIVWFEFRLAFILESNG